MIITHPQIHTLKASSKWALQQLVNLIFITPKPVEFVQGLSGSFSHLTSYLQLRSQ